MWQAMNKEELEKQYSPSSCVDNFDELINQYAVRSLQSESESTVKKDIRYGTGKGELLDVFPTNDPNSPLVIFIHGGYWQALSKSDSTFAGSEFVKAGVAYAAIDYTIAPEGNITHMIDQCTRAVIWLRDHADELGFSGVDIHLAGSSAGAHLAAMTTIQLNDKDLDIVKGLILLSGVYDLQPLVNTYVNEPLNLTMEEAKRISPNFYDLTGLPPALIYYGENETAEFKRQSADFADTYNSAGCTSKCMEVLGLNHFDIVHQLPRFWTILQSSFYA